MTKKAIFVYGRFNPPTRGHKAMIDKLIANAKKMGADPYVVVTHTQNKKKNPLTSREKKAIIEQLYPGVPVLATSKTSPNPIYIVNKMKKNNYTNISMMVGSNRLNSFGFVGIPVLSGGVRDPNSNNVSGFSATKAREAAQRGNLNTFKKIVNTNDHLGLMSLIKTRLLGVKNI